jgi:Kef-type K+ transport system membrane component KefB
MRGPLIVLLLLAGMHLILPLGARGLGSEALLVFGFLILAAYTVGGIASRFGLPKIVGYLAAGALFGPHALATFSTSAAERLQPVSQLAIALIAFLAGLELRWSEVRERGIALIKLMTVELLFSFVALSTTLFLLRGAIPFLRDAPLPAAIAISILFGSFAIAHSPAVTMAILSETRARGPVARMTLGVVLLSDVAVVLLFTSAVAVARFIWQPAGSTEAVTLLGVAWELGGAFVIGSALGAAVAVYLRFVGRELILFAVLVAYLGSEMARLMHVETLLMLIMAGFIAENLSRDGRGDELRHAMERAAAPIFVVFFALSGARIDFRVLAAVGFVIIPLYLVRVAAIWSGTHVGAHWAGAGREGRMVWMGLVSQAGVAIGLANVGASVYPEYGAQLSTIMLSLIAVNEMTGPVLFRRALVLNGEAETEAVARKRVRKRAQDRVKTESLEAS